MAHKADGFPHPLYARYVLLPAYQDAREYFFRPMLAANQAHVVMLSRKEIIGRDNARTLLQALAQVETEGLESLSYQPGVEDLFFAMENRLIEIAGPEFGGNLQLARSRNDLGYSLTRLAVRPGLLDVNERLLGLRTEVLKFARHHLETVMPGYTHTQPAQPTTMAHYMAGVLAFLERDTSRLRFAYATNNQSPLGAAAFTGTSFPIDRDLSARLLGFDGIMESTYDCIGASDNLTDIAAALTSLAINLSRMTKDLLFWATQESGAIRIDNRFIQISSIMPQKRNPVVLEHLRARLSRLLGLAQTITIQCHNIPFGDTQDIEDELLPTLFGAVETAQDILHLYIAVFETLQVNVEHLRLRASAGFTTATELADTLVREAGLPFRSAHRVVSQLVLYATQNKLAPKDLTSAMLAEVAESILGFSLDLSEESLRRALDPQAFVLARTTAGGAAPAATGVVMGNMENRLEEDRLWLDRERQHLAEAESSLNQEIKRLLR